MNTSHSLTPGAWRSSPLRPHSYSASVGQMSSVEPAGAVVSETSTLLIPTARAAADSCWANTAAGLPGPDEAAAHVPLAKLPRPSLTASQGT